MGGEGLTAFLQLVHIGGDIECLGQRIGIDDDVDRVDQLVVGAFGGRVAGRTVYRYLHGGGMVAHHILGHGERDGVAFHGAGRRKCPCRWRPQADCSRRRWCRWHQRCRYRYGAVIVGGADDMGGEGLTAFLQLVHIGGDIECLGQRIGIDDDVDRVDQLVVGAFGGRVAGRTVYRYLHGGGMVAHHILGHGERDGVAFHGAAAGNARADGDLRRIVVV